MFCFNSFIPRSNGCVVSLMMEEDGLSMGSSEVGGSSTGSFNN